MSIVKKRLSMLVVMILIVSLPLGSLVFAEGQNQNSSNDSIQICQTYTKNINAIKGGANGVDIDINSDGTATVYFETTMNCVEVTFSDYTYVSQPKPYEDQVLFSSETLQADTPGHYSITIDLPRCGKSQLDFYMGPVQVELKPETGHDYIVKWVLHEATVCSTPTPTSTEPTPTPTSTEPTPTPTSTEPTPTPTSTEPTPTPTSTEPTPTPTSTEPTPTPTSTEPTPTPTSTEPTPTPTSTEPTPTPTSTEPTPTPTSTEPTPTPTSTEPTPTPTASPTPTPTASPTPTPTPTPTEPTTPPSDPTPTPSPSDDPSPSPEVTPSESQPPSPEPSPSEIIIIEEEEIPRGGPDEEVDQSTDEVVPNVDTLPKTGEASPIPYYLLGSFMAVSGLIALRSRHRQNK